MSVARVFIVDDHPLVRSGVRTELGDAVVVVGEAGDVDGAVQALLAMPDDDLDVVLLDVHMPGGSGGGGAEVVRRVAAKKPFRFLALSVSDAPEDVIAVIRAGARGYITKSSTGAEIAEAVGRIAAGDAAFSPKLAGFVLDAFASGVPDHVEAPVDAELEQLTPREREVLQLIARGYAYKEVGRRLNVSVKTVETHVSSVLRKLQLSSRHELARWATDRRLI
jgi:DNA-binding NarL/FixJ family response regulator